MSVEATTSNGDQIRYSVKELLANIDRKLDALGSRVDGGLAELARRVGVLEARIPVSDDLTQRFLKVESDFGGFERRFARHEDSAGHPESLRRLTEIAADVEHLREREIASDAVTALMRQMADQRRWLIGLSVGSLLSLVGLTVTLIRLVGGGHL